MINLMYVVLMAMLALNVSTEVLDGFALIEDSLKRTTRSAARENQVLYNSFDELKDAIDKYISYYNQKRCKASLGY